MVTSRIFHQRTWSSYTKTLRNLICNFPVFVVKKLIREGIVSNLRDKGVKEQVGQCGQGGEQEGMVDVY